MFLLGFSLWATMLALLLKLWEVIVWSGQTRDIKVVSCSLKVWHSNNQAQQRVSPVSWILWQVWQYYRKSFGLLMQTDFIALWPQMLKVPISQERSKRSSYLAHQLKLVDQLSKMLLAGENVDLWPDVVYKLLPWQHGIGCRGFPPCRQRRD